MNFVRNCRRVWTLLYAVSIGVVLYMALAYIWLDPVRNIKKVIELRRDSVVQAKMPHDSRLPKLPRPK